jgi:hypothetical protein
VGEQALAWMASLEQALPVAALQSGRLPVQTSRQRMDFLAMFVVQTPAVPPVRGRAVDGTQSYVTFPCLFAFLRGSKLHEFP